MLDTSKIKKVVLEFCILPHPELPKKQFRPLQRRGKSENLHIK